MRRTPKAPPARLEDAVVGGITFPWARSEPHPMAPPEKPYRFNEDQLLELRAGLELRTNIMLAGPTGCGKTSLPTQLAARLGQPLVRFNMDGETRVSHLRGQQRPAAEDGVLTLKFSAGDFAEAMRRGWWVLLDEIDAASPNVLFVLQAALEEGRRTLHVPETGETIHAHEDHVVFATGNTVGYRSTSRARHAGTHPLNTAFLDRFGMVIAVDYPQQAEEFERVKCHAPGLADPLVDAITRVAAKCREDKDFRADFSTRRCIQWARLCEVYDVASKGKRDLFEKAFEATVVRKLESPGDAKVAREVFQRLTARRRA